jgi:chromosome segregation ATPase
MTETNTTNLGRTKIVRDAQGHVIEQSLPEGSWTQGPQIPIQPRPAKPSPAKLQDILAQVEAIESELHEASAAFERSLQPGGADPFLTEKVDLAKQINGLRAKLSPLENRLKEIESTPPPAQQYKQTVARAEQLTNGVARVLTDSLAHKKAQELHDQPFESLDRTTQKLILGRHDVGGVVKDIAAAGFARFGKTPEEGRTSEQAKSTAQRIGEAIKLIVDVARYNS